MKRFLAVLAFAASACGTGAQSAPASSPYGDVLARQAGAPVIAGQDGWLHLPADLRFLSVGPFWGEAAIDTGISFNPAYRDPLEPIDDFNRQLADLGIKLLVVPVPPKAAIHPEGLGLTRADAEAALAPMRAFLSELRERGVAVLDLAASFGSAPEGGAWYCRTDSHWSGAGIRRAADEILAWLDAEQLRPALTGTVAWTRAPKEVSFVGDLSVLQKSSATETVTLDVLSGAEPVTALDSPILLMGDSHTLVFHAGGDMHASGAGLADQLAAALGRPVDVAGVRGSGATASRLALMRRMKTDPAYIKGKRVVIWCFAAREFTQADAWRFVPLPIQ